MTSTSPKQHPNAIYKLIEIVIGVVALGLFTSFDLVMVSVFLLIWGLTLIFHKFISAHYPESTRAIATLLVIIIGIGCMWAIEKVFDKDSEQVCGTLIQHEFRVFPHSLFFTPNTIIDIGGEQRTFRTDVHNVSLGSQVCVKYIESDKTLWFFHDYVLDIEPNTSAKTP